VKLEGTLAVEEEKSIAWKKFHIDGAGARPDGTNSGYSFVYLGTDLTRVRRNNGMTNNEAEYAALIAVLRYVARRSRVLIYSDSQLVCRQFSGQYAVREPRLADLLEWARRIISEKNLRVKLEWIPREKNLAGRLLERG
jgi:ribonuclease HI